MFSLIVANKSNQFSYFHLWAGLLLKGPGPFPANYPGYFHWIGGPRKGPET